MRVSTLSFEIFVFSLRKCVSYGIRGCVYKNDDLKKVYERAGPFCVKNDPKENKARNTDTYYMYMNWSLFYTYVHRICDARERKD